MPEPADDAREQHDEPTFNQSEVADRLVRDLDVPQDEHYNGRRGLAWLDALSVTLKDYTADDLRLLSVELAFRVIAAEQLAKQGGASDLAPQDLRRLADTLLNLANQLERK